MGRKKKEIRLKEPVRIREKKIAGGNISLYLDIYQKGLRKKETLKLYLVPEINAATKLQNANTRKLAEQIKAHRAFQGGADHGIPTPTLSPWQMPSHSHTVSPCGGCYHAHCYCCPLR